MIMFCSYKGEILSKNLSLNMVSRYVGLSDDKLPHGWGEMDYQSGSSYSGHWAQGLREGCGVMVSLGALTSRWGQSDIVTADIV